MQRRFLCDRWRDAQALKKLLKSRRCRPLCSVASYSSNGSTAGSGSGSSSGSGNGRRREDSTNASSFINDFRQSQHIHRNESDQDQDQDEHQNQDQEHDEDPDQTFLLQDSFDQALSQEIPRPFVDASFLVNHYTAPALAAAYQDREYTLRHCASLLSEGKLEELHEVLKPFNEFSMEETTINHRTPLSKAFDRSHLQTIRKRLSRLPRQITKAYTQRAAVVIPLCFFQGTPSVLFTLRSLSVGKHKGEVCFPGGMVDASDLSIEHTCLREMEEEVGLSHDHVEVLGILRCDWPSVTSITGIAVTPVLGFIGEMSDQPLVINEQEVESLFTVPLELLMDENNWMRRPNATPVFNGGAHVIWGLTAYLLDYCIQEALVLDKTVQS